MAVNAAGPRRRFPGKAATVAPRSRTLRPWRPLRPRSPPGGAGAPQRSEEHTSELQSLRHLVCRLLLEKKTTTRFCETGDGVFLKDADPCVRPSRSIATPSSSFFFLKDRLTPGFYILTLPSVLRS